MQKFLPVKTSARNCVALYWINAVSTVTFNRRYVAVKRLTPKDKFCRRKYVMYGVGLEKSDILPSAVVEMLRESNSSAIQR